MKNNEIKHPAEWSDFKNSLDLPKEEIGRAHV